MMDECHAEATRLLRDNMDKLTLIAETLKERETLQADEFLALMEGRSLEELDKKKAELLAEQKGMKKKRPKPQQDAEAQAEEAKDHVEETAANAEPAEVSADTETPADAEDKEDEEIPCITAENVVASNGEAIDSEGKKAE